MSNDTLSVDVIEARLQAWAAWRRGGGSADGYPRKSVLHPSWSPPAPGQLPSMPMPRRECVVEGLMDEAVRSLSGRLQDTVTAVYVMRSSVAEQVRLLECQEATVRFRVREAKRLIALWFDALANQG